MAVAIFAAAIAVGCGDDDGSGSSTPINIGAVVSLSGDLGGSDDTLRDAYSMAIREANAAGGLLGREVVLVPKDDATDAARAGTVAGELIDEDQVVAIVGATTSGASLQVAEQARPAEVPQISCCATSPELSTPDQSYFFRVVPPDDLQALVIAREASGSDVGCTSMGIFHLNDSYGDSLASGVQTAFEDTGGSVALAQPFEPQQASYDTEVTAMKAADPECLVLIAFPESAGTLVRDWYSDRSPGDVTWLGADGLLDTSWAVQVVDTSLIDNFRGTAPNLTPQTPQYAAFETAFQTVYSSSPQLFDAAAYDAAALAVLAIAAAGTTDGPAVRDALFDVATPATDGSDRPFGPTELGAAINALSSGTGINYEGAGGPVDFDDLGNVVSGYIVWRYDADEIDPGSGLPGTFVTEKTISSSEILAP